MQESNIQRYTNASNARRALSKIGAYAREAHKTLIKHDVAINSYYFVTKEAEKVQKDAEKLAKHQEKLSASDQLSASDSASAPKMESASKPASEPAPAKADICEAAATQATIEQPAPVTTAKAPSLAQQIVQRTKQQPAVSKTTTKRPPAETRNGVRKPMRGLCADVWAALTALHESNHIVPTMQDVKRLTAENNWNINNATIEFYGWRKFYNLKK